jgi:hypothetical protein
MLNVIANKYTCIVDKLCSIFNLHTAVFDLTKITHIIPMVSSVDGHYSEVCVTPSDVNVACPINIVTNMTRLER